MTEPHNEEILREMVDDVEGQVENLEDQIAQITQRMEEIEGEISVVETTIMTKAADELEVYLDSTKVLEIEQIHGGDCNVVIGPHYNDIDNITSANLTDWQIVDSTTSATVYAYLGTGWDSDPIIIKYISDWDFGEDYLTHPLNTFDGDYGLYANLAALASAVATLTATKNKMADSESILADYFGPIVYLYEKGYIYNGYGALNYLQDCDEYDPEADTWTSKTDTPSPAKTLGMASSIDNKGYTYYGGIAASPWYIQDTEEYDPILDTWANKTNGPSPERASGGASTMNDKGYVYGGTRAEQDCDEYTPDTWANKTDISTPRTGIAASPINNKGYIYYGYSLTWVLDTDEYDPTLDSWVNKSNAPSPIRRDRPTATTIDNKGYVIAGSSSPIYLQDCDEYDPDTWTSKTDCPSPARWYLAASSMYDKGYIYCGLYLLNELQDCDEYTPDTWANKADSPSPGRRYLSGSSITTQG